MEAGPTLTAAAQPLAFSQMSGGDRHTCGLTTANQAYCWGWNAWGQLGDGTNASDSTPAAVTGGRLFRQVAAGGLHTCAVTTDYRAYCWGHNSYGQLGDGTTVNRPTAVPVAGGRLFLEVSAGQSHTCGVTYPDRRAYCWGYGAGGRLGDGTTTSRLMPVAVAGERQFRQVAAGLRHTCGVTTAARVVCWGSNLFGQIGDNSTVERRLTPTRVAGDRLFRQVAAGMSHTCAVTTDHLAFCWGDGRYGQLGNGYSYVRYKPQAVAGGLTFDRVSAGNIHSCGETTLNRAYCWGNNIYGQLGDGTEVYGRNTPVAVAGGHAFAQLNAGDSHTCGRTPTGVGYCWGVGNDGRLGDGTTTFIQRIPVAVVGPM